MDVCIYDGCRVQVKHNNILEKLEQNKKELEIARAKYQKARSRVQC